MRLPAYCSAAALKVQPTSCIAKSHFRLALRVDHLRQTLNCFLRKRLRLPQLVVRASRAAKADSQHSIILQHVEDSSHRIT